MDDKAYEDLKLKVVLMPEATRWHEQPKVWHWTKLQECAAEAHQRVSRAYELLDAVDANPDLSPEGRIKARAKIAEKAVSDFRASNTLEKARTSVASQQAKWAEKVNEAIVPAADHGQAVMYGQIRGHIAGLDEKARLSFVDKHIDDPMVISSVLTAPGFVSGLSDVELGVIRSKLAKRVLAPEIAEQQTLVEKALAVAERGWSRAQRLIEERAGLVPERKGLKVA